MARSIADIKAAIIAEIGRDPVLSVQLTSTSRVAIFNLFAYIIAVCQWTVEKLFDLHITEVNATIAAKNPHTTQWYATTAKDFQLGMDLGEDGNYDNTGLTDDQIEQMKVINYAAVIEQLVNGKIILRIKIATLVNGDLAPVPDIPLAAFIEYMKRKKDAGVRLNISTADPDALKLSIDFYFDPLILNSAGERNDGTDTQPVQNAIFTFLKNLPFNGVFSLNRLNDTLQAVDGYKELKIKYALCKFGALAFSSVDVIYIPDSGYLRIYDPTNDLLINFIPYSE